jgi:hypothetical protein
MSFPIFHLNETSTGGRYKIQARTCPLLLLRVDKKGLTNLARFVKILSNSDLV